jgi:hypothetical protein
VSPTSIDELMTTDWSEYVLVIHPESKESAVYNRKYKLLHEDASQKLISRAQKHNTQVRTGFTLTSPEQQPSWMTEEKKKQCVIYHLYRD